jgi:dTDP-4-dehydrorhamnose reductase
MFPIRTSPAPIEAPDQDLCAAPDGLVVGGDCAIGRALAARLRTARLDVATTSRRDGQAGRSREDVHYLDLETLHGAAALPLSLYLVLVAAETRFSACAAEPERTALVNVAAPVALARRAVAAAGRVLYFSSIAVHDGSRDRPSEDEPPSPNSVYGKQKRTAEERLLALGGDIAVLRPSKVIDRGFPLFRTWLDALRRGGEVEAFADMMVAPVGVTLLADAAARLLTAGSATGIFQLSAAEQVSYADIARHMARRIGAPERLVRPVEAAERSDPTALWLPRFARLGCARLTAAIGVAPPDPMEAVDAFLEAQS